MFCKNNFKLSGKFSLAGASIGGDLSCDGAMFKNKSGPALEAHSLRVGGNIHMGHGFSAEGMISFQNAQIGGSLICDNASLSSPEASFRAESMTVGGSALFRRDFSALGEMSLRGAKISGSLEFDTAYINSQTDISLDIQMVQIGRNLFLRKNFTSIGSIIANDMTIDGGVDVSESSITSKDTKDKIAFQFQRYKVAWSMRFKDIKKMDGRVTFEFSQISILDDDIDSWSKCGGNYFLNGLEYDNLGRGDKAFDADERLGWLRGQHPEELHSKFKPQPWERLASVMRKQGYISDAQKIAIAKQTTLRRAGRIPNLFSVFHYLYGLLMGYGYRPVRIVVFLISVCVVFSVIFSYLNYRSIEETHSGIFAYRDNSSSLARKIPNVNEFPALAYSVDNFFPVLDLGVRSKWIPMKEDVKGRSLPHADMVIYASWTERFIGWITGLLFVSVISGLMKRD